MGLSCFHHSLAKHRSVVATSQDFKGKITLEPMGAHSDFEISTSSRPIPLTKTQRRNKNKKIKMQYERLSREIKEASHVVDDRSIHEISPHLGSSRFHPLSVVEGGENVRRIKPARDRIHSKSSTKFVQYL